MSSNVINLRGVLSVAGLSEKFPHGGGVEAAARTWGCKQDDILDLSTGLHPAGAPDWLAEWLKEHVALAGHYPDVSGEPARSVLAHDFGVNPENVLITAGAQATIEVIFQAMGWRSMAIQVPCYNEPIRCAMRAGCEVRPFESGSQIPLSDVLWLTSPANPTGESCPIHSDFGAGIAGTTCLDESYMSFSQRRTSGLIPGVIRIGSLTKTFCIPGLRLGYVVAEKTVIEQLNQWLSPWPASTLAQHLLPELLPEADRRDEQVLTGLLRLQSLLESCNWKVHASEASFLLARPMDGCMPDFTGHRILVRRFPEWPQLEGWVRFGLPGDEASWQRLEEALCRLH